MSEILTVTMTTSLTGKLGAIAVQAKKIFSSGLRMVEKRKLVELLEDHEVQEFLKSPEMRVLLPKRRES